MFKKGDIVKNYDAGDKENCGKFFVVREPGEYESECYCIEADRRTEEYKKFSNFAIGKAFPGIKEVYVCGKYVFAKSDISDNGSAYMEEETVEEYIRALTEAVKNSVQMVFDNHIIQLAQKTESVDEHDSVNHPSHYTDGKIEVIDFIEDKGLNFHRGNAVKYIARAGKKNPGKEIEDLEKAVWYINREIERLMKEKQK